MTTPDPTAGERECYCPPANIGDGVKPQPDCPAHRPPASPPAVAASTGTSEDVEAYEALADKWMAASTAARKSEHHFPADCLAEAAAFVRGLAAREAAARAEGAAKALADFADALDNDDAAMDVALTGVDYVIQRLTDRAARIAREAR